MKLIAFTLTVSDFRDMETTDENIGALAADVEDAVYSAVSAVADKFDVVVHVEED